MNTHAAVKATACFVGLILVVLAVINLVGNHPLYIAVPLLVLIIGYMVFGLWKWFYDMFNDGPGSEFGDVGLGG